MTTSKQPPPGEYCLTLAPRFSQREQTYKTLVRLETTQLFSTFRYDLSVKEEQTGKSLRLRVLGLKTPQRSLPASGPATFSREYVDMRGTYEVSVQGLDDKVNTFVFRISPKRISLVKSPRSPFVDVVVDPTLTETD